jgi:Lipase (class 3)
MKYSKTERFSRDQVLMTLSAIAYIPCHSIIALQDSLNSAEALEQAYSAIWWGKEGLIMVYLIKNKFTEDYSVILKGPVFSLGLPFLLNLYENFNVGQQVSLPYSRLGSAKVTSGILETIQEIGELTYSGRTLQQVLKFLPRKTKVYITGHSLGGSLAAAYAAKMACSNSGELDIIPYTFGAPAMGNDSFANLFDTSNANSLFTRTSRCVNVRDIVPYLWNDLQGMMMGDYTNSKCATDFSLCIECMERLLIVSKVFYVQPPLQVALKGDSWYDDSFFEEALFQHQPNTYLTLLGLDPIDHVGFAYNERNESYFQSSL